MTEISPTQESKPGESSRFLLMLRAWEAVSTERELPGVLAALADVLAPTVPFDSIGIIDFTTPNAVASEDGERHRLLALHVVGVPRMEGETPAQLAERSGQYGKPPLGEVRPLIPYPPKHSDDDRAAEPFACDDLLKKEGWYRHEFHLAKDGVRSY